MRKSITLLKSNARNRRRKAIRKRLRGTSDRPRLAVFRSLKHIYAQIIDDDAGITKVSMSTVSKSLDLSGKKKVEKSFAVGLKLGEKAIELGIKEVCFDRSGFKYHGRVKALAEGARKAGLSF